MNHGARGLGLNLGLYLHQATRWISLALLPAAVFATLGYIYARHEVKTYQAGATLFVEQAQAGEGGVPSGTDIYGSAALASSYSQVAADPSIQREVDRTLAARYPGYAIEAHGLSSAQRPGQQNSQLIELSVVDAIPQRAADAANAAAAAFIHRIRQLELSRFSTDDQALNRQLRSAQTRIDDITARIIRFQGPKAELDALRATLAAYQSTYSTLLQSAEQFRVTRDAALNSVTVFSPATAPATPIGPHPLRTSAIFGLVALLMCAGGLFLYDYFNDLPRSPEEVEEAAGAPVLGTVQQFNPGRLGTSLVVARQPRSPVSESYRLIRTNLLFTNVDRPPRVIVVSSPLPAEGKSTTVSNLAQAFADSGHQVTLVDADLRRPGLHRIFEDGDGRTEGLTSLLVSSELNGHGIHQTHEPNLKLVASGPVPPNPADLLASARMHAVLSHLRHDDSMVLVDSPPVLAVADAAILSTMADGVVLVVDPHLTKRRDLRQAREAIDAVGGTVLGVVMNRLRPRGAIYYYYYGRYGYTHGYKSGYAMNRSGRSPSRT